MRIPSRPGQPKFGSSVFGNIQDKLRHQFIGPSVGVHQPQIVGSTLLQHISRKGRRSRVGRENQVHCRKIGAARHEDRGLNPLVELQVQVQPRSFDRADSLRLVHMTRGIPREAGVHQIGIRPFQLGMLKDADLEVLGLVSGVFNAVGEVLGDR